MGVARQYCGQLGKQDNCQVAGSLSAANAQGSLPLAYQLYLPQALLPRIPPRGTRGRTPQRLKVAEPPLSVKALANSLPAAAWRTVRWGEKLALSGRFARVRARPAHRTHHRTELPDPLWLLIEWPQDEAEPSRYWLSNLPESQGFQRLVCLTKLRWRIERDYQELKQEVGLSHFEGRSWRGFHHHASMSIAAYGYLMVERLRSQRRSKKNRGVLLDIPPLPPHYVPCGSPRAARTASA